MKVTQVSPVFRMRFCHVRLPIYKKIGVAHSLMHWYKLRLYEQREKARDNPLLMGDPTLLTPHWCILIG
jgi:hypothetical protein